MPGKPEYSIIDNPLLLQYIFYPRKGSSLCPPGAVDISVKVEKGVSISCRFHSGDRKWPTILYFHGNGEVISDYDDVGPYYKKEGLNFLVVDYRGYGTSEGTPSFTGMMKDAHIILSEVRKLLLEDGFEGPLWVMGRSLGSASALELAYHYPSQINGLIIESGFTSAGRFLKHLNLLPPGIDLEEFNTDCLERLQEVAMPVLVIHGEYDDLVPLQEAKDLYENIGSGAKEMIVIPADHNTVMIAYIDYYFEDIKKFILKNTF